MRHEIVYLILFLLIISAVPVLSQTYVSVDPKTQTQTTGQSAIVVINITNAQNLYGFQFDISYDASNLQDSSPPPNVTYGNFLGTPFVDTYCVIPTLTTGLIENIACTRIISGNVSGGGDLVSIDFTAYSVGTSPITILDLKLSDEYAQNLSRNYYNGQIIVEECTDGENKTKTNNCFNNTGACQYGYELCFSGAWDDFCHGGIDSTPEICNILPGDDDDDDCDGTVNNVFGGTNAIESKCACYGDAPPTGSETCNDIDDDCNGAVDDSISARYCNATYFGICGVGTENCISGVFSGCQLPNPNSERTEAGGCNNGVNDDCDPDERDNPCGGDINRDCDTSIGDLSFIAVQFGYSSTHPSFDAMADPNYDNLVDLFDLVIVGSDFSTEYNVALHYDSCCVVNSNPRC